VRSWLAYSTPSKGALAGDRDVLDVRTHAIALIAKPTGLFGLPIAPRPGTASEETFLAPTSSTTSIGSTVEKTPWWKRPTFVWTCVIFLFIAGLVCPVVLPTYYVRLFTLALIWSIFAMSLDLILGLGGIVSLGHARLLRALRLYRRLDGPAHHVEPFSCRS